MAQQLESKSLIPVEQSDQFPRLKKFFDCADFIVDRSKSLMGNSKDLSLRLFLLLFVIKDLILFFFK
jgi:hypothetical protein